MEQLTQHLEALIFCSETALSLDEMAAALKLSYDWDLEDEILLNAIDQVRQKYINEDFAFELREINGGYQFFTKKMFHPTIGALIQHKSRKKLSVAQMEVLSIIAYKQPISKTEVEHIRGVNCDYPVQKLLEKNLVEIAGKSDGPGKPLMYDQNKMKLAK
jgi:segregation and condensation protein B